MMDDLIRDLRYAVRRLIQTPLFTAVAILTLGLGIGANTAIFTLVNKALLKPLPVREPDRIVALSNTSSDGRMSSAFSYLNYKDLRERSGSAIDLLAYAPAPVSLSHDGINERLWGYLVSGNYFDTLGLRPAAGRLIAVSDDLNPGSHPVAVISHDSWRRRFGGDPGVIGREVLVNGRRFTIIGVAPPGFVGIEVAFTAEVWFPMMMQSEISPRSPWRERRGFENLYVAGRVRNGWTEPSVRSALRTAAAGLAAEYPNENQGKTIALSAAGLFGAMGRGAMIGISGAMMAVVALVLLLVCTNLVNLCLARSTHRQREIAMQQALGASRWRIIRQLLTESLVLSTAGGVVGLALSYWLTASASRFRLPVDLPFSYRFELDWRVLVFTFAVSMIAGITFGIIPAWQSASPEKHSAFRRSRLRGVLVAAQVGLSFILMTCAGLTMRSLQRAQFVDLGMNPQNAVEVGFDLDLQGYSRERRAQFVRQLLDRVGSLPGMGAAGIGTAVPPDPHIGSIAIRVEGMPPSERGMSPRAIAVSATQGYRAALAIPLLRGRDLLDSDTEGSPAVAMVNEEFARRFWGGEDPVGKHFAFRDVPERWIEIVGVIRDGKYRSLGEAPSPFMMLPLLQSSNGLMKLVARDGSGRGNRLEDIRREIRALDANLPVFDAQTLTEHMRLPLFPATVAAAMFGSFGSLALVLAALGVFGVVSFTVNRRTQEIGIRMALGARRTDVIRMIVRQGMTPIAIGMAVGLAGTRILTPVLQMGEVLYGVRETDPATFFAIVLLLGAVGLAACYFPARRAARMDPLVALRQN